LVLEKGLDIFQFRGVEHFNGAVPKVRKGSVVSLLSLERTNKQTNNNHNKKERGGSPVGVKFVMSKESLDSRKKKINNNKKIF